MMAAQDARKAATAELAAIPGQYAQPPADMVGKLPKAGITLDYVGHATVTKILLDIDPLWTLEPICDERGIPIVETNAKNECVMWGRLTVLGHTRLGVGSCPGGAFDREKQLVGDLLRNCAMRFGIATALWSKEEWSQPAPTPPPPPVVMASPQVVDMLTAGLAALTEAELEQYNAWRQEHNIPSLRRGVTEDQADEITGWLDADAVPALLEHCIAAAGQASAGWRAPGPAANRSTCDGWRSRW
jgi:hypothetical protein